MPSTKQPVAVFYTSIQPYFYSYLQVVHHQSITAAGHITQTFSFTSTVSSIVIGFVIKYTHHYKYYITTGACIYLLGIGLLIRYRTESSSIGSIVGTQIAVGIGGGLINVPAQLGVQASVSHGDVAAVTAIFLTIVEIGGAVGAAISGAVWTAKLPEKLALYLPEANKADAALIFGNLTLAQSYARGTPEGIAISRAYQETMNTLLIIAACFCIPMLPLSLLMRNYRLGEVCFPLHPFLNPTPLSCFLPFHYQRGVEAGGCNCVVEAEVPGAGSCGNRQEAILTGFLPIDGPTRQRQSHWPKRPR